MPAKTIGVLGGMGPEATVFFFQKLVQLTPAKFDQDHIPIIIYNNPQVPDRTKAILNHDKSPIPILQTGLSILKNAGADFACIPCNTAHYFIDDMQKQVELPIISIIDSVVEYALDNVPDLEKIGLLATIGTTKSCLYQNAFGIHKVDVIVPDDSELADLQNIIQSLKNKSKDSSPVQCMAEVLIRKGIQALILGCTELSLISSELDLIIPILDSTEILAGKAVQEALIPKDTQTV